MANTSNKLLNFKPIVFSKNLKSKQNAFHRMNEFTN